MKLANIITLTNTIILFLMCLITLLSFLIVTTSSPIRAVLMLIAVFFLSSITLILVGADFIGLIYILIYIGAVLILFLWVVMTVPIKQNIFSNYLFVFIFVILTLLFIICFVSLTKPTTVKVMMFTFNSSFFGFFVEFLKQNYVIEWRIAKLQNFSAAVNFEQFFYETSVPLLPRDTFSCALKRNNIFYDIVAIYTAHHVIFPYPFHPNSYTGYFLFEEVYNVLFTVDKFSALLYTLNAVSCANDVVYHLDLSTLKLIELPNIKGTLYYLEPLPVKIDDLLNNTSMINCGYIPPFLGHYYFSSAFGFSPGQFILLKTAWPEFLPIYNYRFIPPEHFNLTMPFQKISLYVSDLQRFKPIRNFSPAFPSFIDMRLYTLCNPKFYSFEGWLHIIYPPFARPSTNTMLSINALKEFYTTPRPEVTLSLANWLSNIFDQPYASLNSDWMDIYLQSSHFEPSVLAKKLYSTYSLLLVMLGIILLVAMVGSIVLVKFSKTFTKSQIIANQIERDDILNK